MAYERGLGLLRAGSIEDAALAFKQALGEDPTHHEAHFQLGVCHFRMGRDGDELEAYRACLDANPDYVPALLGLAFACEAREDYDGARRCYVRVLHLEPGNSSARIGMECLPNVDASTAWGAGPTRRGG